jgi:hypothetical protein
LESGGTVLITGKRNRELTLSDTVLDSATSDSVFPVSFKKYLNSFVAKHGSITVGNNEQLTTLGVGRYGVLYNILLCAGIILPLISVIFLTNTGKVWNPPNGVRGTLPEPPEPLFVHHPLKISTWKFFVHLKEPSWRGLKNFHIEIFNSELKVSMRKFLFTQISILK